MRSSSIRWNQPILEVLCLMTRFRWEVDGSWRFIARNQATIWYKYSFRMLCSAEAYMQLKDKMRTEFAKDGCLMWSGYTCSIYIYVTSIHIYIYIIIRATPGFCPSVAAYICPIHEQMMLQITIIPMGKITQILETIKQTRSKQPKFLWEKQKRHNTCNSYGKTNKGTNKF